MREGAARIAEVLARERCQTSLPVAQFEPASTATGWLDPLTEQIIIAGLVVVLLLAIGAALFALYTRLSTRKKTSAPLAPAPEPVPEPQVVVAEGPGPTLIDADRLAASGDFREALHLLLLVAIKVCAGRSSIMIPRSATSRELRALLPLGDRLREGFSTLVAAVERSLFAQRPVGPGDYASCRERCVELLGGRLG